MSNKTFPLRAWSASLTEMVARIRTHDWAATPLGPVQQWPASLRAAVRLCLDSGFPTCVYAGPELRLVYNDAFVDALGSAKHPWAFGRPAREVWAEIWDQIAPEFEQVLGRSTLSHDDFGLMLERGGRMQETFWTYAFAPIRDDGGRIVGVFDVATETTARKRAEGDLSVFRILSEHSNDAQFLIDAHGRLRWVNRLAAERLGYSREEMLTLTVGNWNPLVSTNAFGAYFERARAGRVAPFESVHRRRDGTTFPVEITPTVVELHEGALMLAAVRDITERKQAEEKLRRADRAKTEFLAMLAHELRNPLAPLANAVALIERRSDDPPTIRGALGIMRRQIKHLSRLVGDLLEISRIEHGKIDLKVEPIVLAHALGAAVEIVQPMIEQRQQRLAVVQPSVTTRIAADAARITQVVANLLHNAGKFTPEGGAIELAVEEREHEIAIIVRDEGRGITPEALPHIFEVFEQGEVQPLDRSQGGLGIGLALVKRLVEMHGGTVTAESMGQGAGARFTVTLPREVHP